METKQVKHQAVRDPRPRQDLRTPYFRKGQGWNGKPIDSLRAQPVGAGAVAGLEAELSFLLGHRVPGRESVLNSARRGGWRVKGSDNPGEPRQGE